MEEEGRVINDPERFMAYENADDKNNSLRNSERLKSILGLINRDGMKILDVGGASGVFLKIINENAKHKIIGYNLDFDPYYKDKQVNDKIKFINGSIIDSKIGDNQFDIVTFRHVLHHLIGNSIRETKENQKRALSEMFRIVKKGGYVIFEEEVNKIKLFSRIVFYLSKIANKWGIKSKGFQAGDVIVSFLTPRELERMIADIHGEYNIDIIGKSYKKWKMGLKWKITLLMGWVGSVSYLTQANKVLA